MISVYAIPKIAGSAIQFTGTAADFAASISALSYKEDDTSVWVEFQSNAFPRIYWAKVPANSWLVCRFANDPTGQIPDRVDVVPTLTDIEVDLYANIYATPNAS